MHKTVEFRHPLAEALRQGLPVSEVPQEFRVDGAAFGVSFLRQRGGYRLSLTNYFVDVHESLRLRDAVVVQPVRTAATVLENPEWIRFQTADTGAAIGALAVADIGPEAARQLEAAEGDLRIRMTLEVDGQPRQVEVPLERIERTWLFGS